MASLGHMPSGERWEFDDDVVRVFDDMLERSIPELETMRALVSSIGAEYVRPDTDIVDLGCSKGDALAPLAVRFGTDNRYIGIDVSEPMLAAARERFAFGIAKGAIDIRNFDLRNGFPDANASLILSVLTLMFTPINYRHRIISDAYDRLMDGGALILVEKVLGATADIDRLMILRYHDYKHRSGYSWDEIERKRLSLEGALVPVTARWNEELLGAAGFRQIDCFWRWLNFAGWLAVK